MIIVKATQQKTTTWSGGTTTELFIYPESAKYSDRNFDFRISTATVDIEESTFTQLPGYKRILMILQGELFIEHKNHHTGHLKKYDCDEFLGEWETHAKGKVVDFNLMMNEQTKGNISIIDIDKQTTHTVEFGATQFIAFYVLKGLININSKDLSLKDFVSIEKEKSNQAILITAIEDCKLIKIEIFA